MIYLTYNDAPSGIYNSQVIDVVNYLNTIQNTQKITLVALISIRDFKKNKLKIKLQLSNSIVIPMFPKVGLWRFNIIQLFFVCLLLNSKQIIGRGVFATNLALTLKKIKFIKKVIFDARGAYHAELTEYNVISNKKIISQIKNIENKAISCSDYRLAVSEALVGYWKKNYGYNSQNHVVIPCTLSSDFIFEFPTQNQLKNLKQQTTFLKNEDIVLVYSGSSAGWQSFTLLEEWLLNAFKNNEHLKLIMLTNHPPQNSTFFDEYKNRIYTKWLQPTEVKNMLLIADYGLMYREDTVTNQVASPVKFAEYLSCGLQIITSTNLGDFSDFVKTKNCGFVLPSQITFTQVDYSTKKQNYNLAMQFLIKQNYKQSYLKLLACE